MRCVVEDSVMLLTFFLTFLNQTCLLGLVLCSVYCLVFVQGKIKTRIVRFALILANFN